MEAPDLTDFKLPGVLQVGDPGGMGCRVTGMVLVVNR